MSPEEAVGFTYSKKFEKNNFKINGKKTRVRRFRDTFLVLNPGFKIQNEKQYFLLIGLAATLFLLLQA
jgi:hypothetical protein